MSSFIKALSCFTLFLTLANSAQAHFYVENPSCRAPKKPLQFVTDLDKQEFDNKVQAYRQCLEEFVNKQNSAMEKHKQSADKAAEIWRAYVEKTLGQKIKPEGEAKQTPANPDKAATTPKPKTPGQ